MVKCLCDEGYERCLCDEGYERCLCDGREGVPIMNLPPPKRVFSPTPPFAGKPETRFYLKPKNSLIINHLFKLLIINVLL
jgi:hypothetical protein